MCGESCDLRYLIFIVSFGYEILSCAVSSLVVACREGHFIRRIIRMYDSCVKQDNKDEKGVESVKKK